MSYCDFWRVTNVKATRGHKHSKTGEIIRHSCQWCGQKIEIGDPAVAFASYWEGDFGSGY